MVQVTDVRIIKDAQTRRSKGIAYVEFEKQESCPMAVAKSGQIICGFPVVIQASQAEKNIAAKQAAALGVSGFLFICVALLLAPFFFACIPGKDLIKKVENLWCVGRDIWNHVIQIIMRHLTSCLVGP